MTSLSSREFVSLDLHVHSSTLSVYLSSIDVEKDKITDDHALNFQVANPQSIADPNALRFGEYSCVSVSIVELSRSSACFQGL